MSRPFRLVLPLALAAACRTAPAPSPEPVPAPPAPRVEKPETPENPPTNVMPPPGDRVSPYAREDIAKLRAQAKETLAKQADMYWKSWVFGSEPDLAAAYAGKDALYSAGTVKVLRDAAAQARGDEARALRYFMRYVAGEVLAQQTAPVEDQLAALENTAQVAVGDVKHAWKDLDELIAAEPGAEARAKLYESEAPVLARLQPLVVERNRKLENAAKQLGWDSAGAFAAEIRDVELEALGALARRTLDETDIVYNKAMDKLAIDELALPLSKLRRSDLPRLLRLGRNDGAFPANQLIPTGMGVFRALGLDMQGRKGLTLHTANLPTKNPRPVTFAVEVPTDVRVSVKPAAGVEFLRELLHELAHAAADLSVKREEWEFQALDGAAVREAWAAAVSTLVDAPAFVKETTSLKGPELAKYVRNANARRLFALRHAAARVMLEVALRTQKNADPVETWRKAGSRAFGFELTTTDAQRWVLEDTGLVQAADELRGALLAAQLAQALQAKFGEAWWKNAGAGKFLEAQWAEGTRLGAGEVAAALGGELGPGSVVGQVTGWIEQK